MIPHRTKALDGVPAALRSHYRETSAGDFILDVDLHGALRPVEAQRDRWKRIAEDRLVGDAVDEVVERLGVADEWAATVRAAIRKRLRVRLPQDEGHAPEVFVADDKGEQAFVPDGRNLTLDLIGTAVDREFTQTYAVTWEGAKEGGRQEGETQGHRPQDVALQPGYTNDDFAHAMEQARRQGGEVVLPPKGGNAPPRPVIRLPSSYSLREFEAAVRESQRTGRELEVEDA